MPEGHTRLKQRKPPEAGASSVHSQCLHSRGQRVTVENRVDSFHDVRRHVQEVALVLDWDEGPAGPVVHAYLERLNEGADCLDVSLDAEVTEDQ